MPSYFRLEGISFIGESIARFEDYLLVIKFNFYLFFCLRKSFAFRLNIIFCNPFFKGLFA